MNARDPGPEILFVYNADRGALNALIDSVHKLVSPATYQCSLCALTHTAVGERKAWRRFVESLDHPVRFLHRDEFETPAALEGMTLPAILLEHPDDSIELLMDAGTIDRFESSEDLAKALGEKLAA